MITTAQEYYDNLWRINSFNSPNLAILLPETEKIYEVNLNNRTIEAPEYLSVERDHRAEIIYFVVDRFYDHFDLVNTTCVIQYFNKSSGKGGVYAVPFYDIYTASTETSSRILFPWCLEGPVTEVAGDIEYSIRFFTVGENKVITYNLNTLPSTSKVLYGFSANLQEYYEPVANSYEELLQLINQVKDQAELYWDILE